MIGDDASLSFDQVQAQVSAGVWRILATRGRGWTFSFHAVCPLCFRHFWIRKTSTVRVEGAKCHNCGGRFHMTADMRRRWFEPPEIRQDKRAAG